MPLMNPFEPLFLLLALLTIVTLAAAAVYAATGRTARAVRLLRRLAIGAGIYFTVAIVTSLVLPRREFRVGEERCFDDWCLTVTEGHRDGPTVYVVTLRLASRARRRPMGEKGTGVYLTDAQGRRFDPRPDPAALPFDTVLQPGTSVETVRRFDVPAGATGLGLIYGREGGFPIDWFVISEGGWFSRPAIVRLE